MSIFKKIRGSIRDEELLSRLCEHLRKISINATVLVSEPKVQAFSNNIGSLNVEDLNIDLVEVEMKLVGGEDYSTSVYRINYVVLAEIDGLERKLKAEAKPIKKGFLSKEVVDLKWEGGSLAQLLNSDSDLKTMLLREELVETEIRPDKKSQCVRMRQKPFYPKSTLAFPTREVFDVYDRIAQHIRSILSTHNNDYSY